MELMDAIKNRRSVRKYRTGPVSDEVVQAVLEAARWAPSWANTQCCRFIVVRDAELKARLEATIYGTTPSLPAFTAAPVVVVVCAEREKSGYYHGAPMTNKGD